MKFYNFSTLQFRIYFFLLAFIIGFINAWFVRNSLDFDGLPNLDMGDLFFQGNWSALINGMWSPLYPFILGLILHLFKPTSYWESAVVHCVNFFIYLFAFFSFDFFLQQLIKYNKQKEANLLGFKLITLPEWALLSLGYSFFIWSSIDLVTMSRIMPDILATVFVYLAAGILLKIKSGATSWVTFIIFGIVLALGYLTKTAMFLIAFVFIGTAFFVINDKSKRSLYVLIALITFLLASSPYIILLSKSKGYLTFGESGKVNYLWEVNGINEMDEIRDCSMGDFSQCERLIHPVRIIYKEPMVYEFSTPFKVTYPPWYDPSYWISGFLPQIDLKGQIKAIVRSAKVYLNLIYDISGVLLAYLILLFISPGKKSWLKDITKECLLLIPPLLVIGMYSLVHVETRYISSFIVIFLLGLFSTLKLPDSKKMKKLIAYIIGIIVIFMTFTSIFSTDLIGHIKIADPYKEWKVSEGLKKIGIKEGDKVAVIPGASDVYWARFAKVHIIAEIRPEVEANKFWAANDSVKSQIYQAFKKVGVKVIVAITAPPNASSMNWKNIKDTPYYYYVL